MAKKRLHTLGKCNLFFDGKKSFSNMPVFVNPQRKDCTHLECAIFSLAEFSFMFICLRVCTLGHGPLLFTLLLHMTQNGLCLKSFLNFVFVNTSKSKEVKSVIILYVLHNLFSEFENKLDKTQVQYKLETYSYLVI